MLNLARINTNQWEEFILLSHGVSRKRSVYSIGWDGEMHIQNVEMDTPIEERKRFGMFLIVLIFSLLNKIKPNRLSGNAVPQFYHIVWHIEHIGSHICTLVLTIEYQ